MTAVTTDFVSLYERDGFVVARELLATADVERILNRIVAIASGRVSSFPKENIELEPRPDTAGNPVARKINQCVEHDTVFMELARDSRILDLVESLIGPDIKLYGSQCFMKPPGGVEKPYHQDSAYFTIEPRNLVTCWIALDDVTVENGCLWVIPGSHRGELFDHSQPWQVGDRVDMQIPDDLIDRTSETAVVMPAGSCSFHHSVLMHRSGPNQTHIHRRGLAIHYMSAHSRWTHTSKPKPNFPLLRGREYDGCV